MSGTDSEAAPAKRRGRPKKAAAFAEHVENIERARRQSEELMEECAAPGKTPHEVLKMAWEIVFDFFYRAKSGTVEISELNTLAGIVQKLVSSSGHLAAADSKGGPKASGAGLTEEGMREIERKLKLL